MVGLREVGHGRLEPRVDLADLLLDASLADVHDQKEGHGGQKDEREREQGDVEPARLALLRRAAGIVGVLDGGEALRYLPGAQACVEEQRVVQRELSVAESPVDVAAGVEQLDGQRLQRAVVLRGAADVSDGGAGEPAHHVLLAAQVAAYGGLIISQFGKFMAVRVQTGKEERPQ